MNNIDLLTPTKIIKTMRRSLSLILNNKGEFIVRAPLQCSNAEILAFINKKSNWIITKRLKLLNSLKPLKFENDEVVPLLGINFKIKLSDNNNVIINQQTIIIPKNNSKDKLITFLKRKIKEIINNKVNFYSKMYSFSYKTVSISSAKTNWGSCSYNNKLHFTYKLIFCPEHIIDYIVLHELTHTQIKNHSKNFWQKLASVCINYKNCENWLKEHKGIMELI